MRRYTNRVEALDKESAGQVVLIERTKTKALQSVTKERDAIVKASNEGAEAMAKKMNEVFAKRKTR